VVAPRLLGIIFSLPNDNKKFPEMVETQKEQNESLPLRIEEIRAGLK